MSPGPELTIFLHVPKTAGTSLRRVFEQVYPEEARRFLYSQDFAHDPAELAALRDGMRGARLVFGHLSWGLHDILGVPAQYATVVRDPVARVVSYFEHQKRDPGSEWHDDIAGGMTLVDLLRSEDPHQINNHMTRIVSGRDIPGALFDREPLEQAVRNLETDFVAVGVTEQMERSVRLLAERLAWGPHPPVPRLNVNPDPVEDGPDRATLDEILRCNALDVELYQRVVAGF